MCVVMVYRDGSTARTVQGARCCGKLSFTTRLLSLLFPSEVAQPYFHSWIWGVGYRRCPCSTSSAFPRIPGSLSTVIESTYCAALLEGPFPLWDSGLLIRRSFWWGFVRFFFFSR